MKWLRNPEFPAIVTKFHLKSLPLAPTVRRCTYVWPVTSYETVFNWVLEVMSARKSSNGPMLKIFLDSPHHL